MSGHISGPTSDDRAQIGTLEISLRDRSWFRRCYNRRGRTQQMRVCSRRSHAQPMSVHVGNKQKRCANWQRSGQYAWL